MSRPSAFVLMPFEANFDDIYSRFIAEALDEAGYNALRADNIQSQRSILHDIIESIVECDLLVSDLTTTNPNVFYELGIAHTLSKPVVLLTQDIDEIPFDLQPYRVVEYGTHFTKMRKAKSELVALAGEARSDSIPFGNPFSDFINSRGVGIADLSHSVETTPEELERDKGFLDYLAEFEEATIEMVEAIKSTGSELKALTEKAQETERNMSRAKKNKQSAAIYVRQLARKLAKDTDSFAQAVAQHNNKFSKSIDEVEKGLDFILSIKRPLDRTQKEELLSFLQVIDATLEQATNAKKSIAELSEIMLQLQGLERQLSKAVRHGSEELDQFVSYTKQTISVLKRAKNNAQRWFDK